MQLLPESRALLETCDACQSTRFDCNFRLLPVNLVFDCNNRLLQPVSPTPQLLLESRALLESTAQAEVLPVVGVTFEGRQASEFGGSRAR